MFPNSKGKQASKLEMVNTWRTSTGMPVSGHSARRLGAMAYVRKGMSIQELAFLGRWRSTVVLTYAEEALQTVPSNAGLKSGHVLNDKAIGSVAAQTPRVAPCPSLSSCSTSQEEMAARGRRSTRLWVRSSVGGRAQPLHLVSNASWQMAICDWSTACGWTFAKKSANVLLVTAPALGTLKCRKCLEVDKTRDDVKVGVSPAQLVAEELMPHQVTSGRVAETDGKAQPVFRPKRKRVEGGYGFTAPVLKV